MKKTLAFFENICYYIVRCFYKRILTSEEPWKPNVKRVKAIVNGTPKHVYVCTRCLRSGKVTRAV